MTCIAPSAAPGVWYALPIAPTGRASASPGWDLVSVTEHLCVVGSRITQYVSASAGLTKAASTTALEINLSIETLLGLSSHNSLASFGFRNCGNGDRRHSVARRLRF